MVDKKRGRPKKEKVEVVEKSTPKTKIKVKKEEKKVYKIKALRRVTHYSRTYEVGEIIMEPDEEMAKQILDKNLGVEV